MTCNPPPLSLPLNKSPDLAQSTAGDIEHSTALYCIVLYCIVLYCIVLYCIVLYCIVLYCIVLYCIVLYCIVLYCIVLQLSIQQPICLLYGEEKEDLDSVVVEH